MQCSVQNIQLALPRAEYTEYRQHALHNGSHDIALTLIVEPSISLSLPRATPATSSLPPSGVNYLFIINLHSSTIFNYAQ